MEPQPSRHSLGSMKTLLLLLLLLCLVAGTGRGEFAIAENGRARCVVVVDPAASPPEQTAARELVAALRQITGVGFLVSTNTVAPEHAIVVGRGEAASGAFAGVSFDTLGSEEFVVKTRGTRLLIAGGRPRGTLYAVSWFLQRECGVRWWTPWASRIPRQPVLKVGDLDLREAPAFEYREPFWYPAFDADWSWRNGCNGQSSRLAPEQGGRITYQGFVHTFYPLVPPEKHFAEHPEWYSLIKGQRSTNHAQLCLTNPKLLDFVVEQVRRQLYASPGAGIVSVSQNDWHGACQCDACKALDDAEGTHAGTMLSFVNQVAERIEPEFPRVAVDTLAYQYTRKPPKTLRPRANVIVRLCSIECNFREPLDHPSNAAFADDIRGWSRICGRLYIWDYTTDFGHYVQPHPNWFVLGPNLRFFQEHNVRGVFEQGAYQSHGSEMAELRAWVLARLLWNPRQDDRALVREFLEGYYGAAAAPFLGRYLELMHGASAGYKLGCFASTDGPHLRFKPLAEAEQLWQQAEAASAGDPDRIDRVRLGHLAVRHAWLARWSQLRGECAALGATWPLSDSRQQVADDWMAVARVNEGGLTPERWAARFARESSE
ncbi:MAG: DUF4838 domain-containing protein [Verrucomicrobia bacterium]|nr:MAG: DUF4838 domain-containing protein [Verrucomicrobiota bacterium]